MALIHVVGAGPAGSIAAVSALRKGHDVVISEDHAMPGIPENCSGLFSKEGLESLGGFLDYRKHVVRPIKGADLHIGGHKLSVRRKEPVGFVCGRSGMDQELASLAESEGARIRFGERINGVFRSPHVIGADGPLSGVARHFGFPPIKKYAATLQAEIPYRCEDPEAVEVFLSPSMFPGFFGWVIPRDEYTAEFGVGVEMPAKPRESWVNLLRLKRVDCAPKPKGAVIPLSVRRSAAMSVRGGSVLLAGDAAGQVKSTTGGGVIFGGGCARLAGMHATSPMLYELMWRSRFGADLKMHSFIHDYISSLSDMSLSDLGRRLKKLNFDGYLSKHGHMDRPTRMVGPHLAVLALRHFTGF